MPLGKYSVEDPFENHPLFKSEAGAPGGDARRSRGSRAGPALPWPGEDETAEGAALDDGLWGRSRDFDWGE